MFDNPVGGPRIVPFGQPRKPTDVLKNGHPGFRVTQSFNHWDAIFRNRIHGAMDIGNFFCGDSLKAMDSGTAIHLRDPNGALGVEVRHPNGYRTQLWHMGRISLKVPSGSVVRAGERLGRVGRTGLDIGGCHCHVVVLDPTGRRVDPWPLLNQNR